MLLTFIGLIVVLGIIVLAHELGHFISARIFKVKVEEFGLGFPPRFFGIYKDKTSKKRKFIFGSKIRAEDIQSTVYSLNKIPIGGFVKIKGQDGDFTKDADSFASKSAWKKSIILVAGVFANFVLCAIFLSVGYFIGMPNDSENQSQAHVRTVRDNQIQIVSINSNSPAETAGLKIGDAILSLDNKKNENISIKQIQEYTSSKDGLLMTVQVKRGEDLLEFEIIPRILDDSHSRAAMGVGLIETATISYKWYVAIWYGIKNTIYITGAIFMALWSLIKNIILTGEVSADIAGPVGIAVIAGQSIKLGFIYILQFTALLSVNLAIINILPFPALDGGRLLFIIIEKIRGKEINKKIENIIHTTGFVILMILVVLVTYRDLARWGGQLFEKII
ncbi:MAG: RIP metalloprotease RseP [Patescibacteria group bacterium]